MTLSSMTKSNIQSKSVRQMSMLSSNPHYKYSNLRLACTGLALLLLSACAGQSGETFQAKHQAYQLSSPSSLTAKQRADLYQAIMAADMATFKQDYLTATRYFLYAASISKEKELIQRSIESARNADDPLGLEQAAQIWLELEPNSQQAKTVLLEAQLSLGNTSAAIETTLEIFAQLENEEEKYDFLKINAMGHAPRTTNSYLRELFNALPDSTAIITAHAKFIFDLTQQNPKAASLLERGRLLVERALSLDPGFFPAIQLKSHILYQLRQDQEAVDFLKQIYLANPENNRISHMLGQLYYDLRNFQASANHFTGWLKEHPEDIEARYYEAASYYALGQYHLSLSGFKKLLDKGFRPNTVAFYCGDSAHKAENIELALDCYSKVGQSEFFIKAKIQTASILAQTGKVEQALASLKVDSQLEEDDQVKLLGAEINLLNRFQSKDDAKAKLETALKNYPDNLSLLLKKIELYELTQAPKKLYQLLNQVRDLVEAGPELDRFDLASAALLKNNEHYQLAINWLDRAIEEKPEDKDLLYTRAIYKESLALYDEMIQEFKYLLTLFPDDLNIKNALGYTLADTGKDLDYAQELIDSAFEGLPDNAAVIDSKGWLAYRKGEFEIAEQFLVKAFKMAPSAEGAAHLGEVFWKTGKVEFAKGVWRKGLSLDKDNRVLNETLERLNINLE
ncbi:tetratricopeptide repeat protein [Aliikangiella sp. G2MR2-5]|uniref:tetratricopeptide repeat protein n=1 Tax=Aliikangiella sp. G2MR2-5 TaxID=2788943 RepID=UPI0018AC1521|nr:tetratricopeptide repeat protein [Aliikangiella sp. G2MR2-5]